MNRKKILSALAMIVLFVAGCNHHKRLGPITVTLSGTVPEGIQTGGSVVLAATVANDPTNSGVIWTCASTSGNACPASTFTPATTLSGANVTFQAGGIVGTVILTATSAEDGTISASTTSIVVSNPTGVSAGTYTFYVAGTEADTDYALAGSFTIGLDGTVTGEQDFNDGVSTTNVEGGGGDQFDVGSAMTTPIDPTTGQGVLTVVTVEGSATPGEVLAVQFVNPNHALITEYDDVATSSGSADFQTSTAAPTGSFSFILPGYDTGGAVIVQGGVFTSDGANVSAGLVDTNDNGVISAPGGVAFTGTITAPDAFGRGTFTPVGGITVPIAYYVVGPEAIRIINVDPVNVDFAVGSAFGQGSGGFTNSSLATYVLSVSGTPVFVPEVLLGQFTAVPNGGSDTVGGTFSAGVADVNEVDLSHSVPDVAIDGTYSLNPNGYGTLTITPDEAGDYSSFGIYAVDPTLNINDPNNTATDLGGALVADMDTLVIGSGVLVPQTDATTADFTGNYAFGAQYMDNSFDEADFIGSSAVDATLDLTGVGFLNDPDNVFSSTPLTASATFAGTLVDDGTGVGRSVMATPGLTVTANASPSTLATVVAYQASGTQVFWMENDPTQTFSGQLQQQAVSPTGNVARRAAAKKTKKH